MFLLAGNSKSMENLTSPLKKLPPYPNTYPSNKYIISYKIEEQDLKKATVPCILIYFIYGSICMYIIVYIFVPDMYTYIFMNI